jgi:hypothetical protein
MEQQSHTTENQTDRPLSLEVATGPFAGMTFDICNFEITDDEDGSGLMTFDINLTDLNEKFSDLVSEGNKHHQYAECIQACGGTASEILTSALESAYIDHMAQLKIQDPLLFEETMTTVPFETHERRQEVLEKIEQRVKTIQLMDSLDRVEEMNHVGE